MELSKFLWDGWERINILIIHFSIFVSKSDGDDMKTRSEMDQSDFGYYRLMCVSLSCALGGYMFGWQYLFYYGFSAAMTAAIFMALFFALYSCILAELIARYIPISENSSNVSFNSPNSFHRTLPNQKLHTGTSTFMFVKYALGTRLSLCMAIFSIWKFILTNCAISVTILLYLSDMGMPQQLRSVIFFIVYSLHFFLELIGIRQFSYMYTIGAAACVVVLLSYFFISFGYFRPSVNESSAYGDTSAVSSWFNAVLRALPFVVQLYRGFDDLPLLTQYIKGRVDYSISTAMIFTYIILLLFSILIIYSASGTVSSFVLFTEINPIVEGVNAVDGEGSVISVLIFYLVILCLNMNFSVFAMYGSQHIQIVAEAGFLPSIFAYRYYATNAPLFASTFQFIIGIALTFGMVYIFGESSAQITFLMGSLACATLGYALPLECIIRIRKEEEKIQRNDYVVDYLNICYIGQDPGCFRLKYAVICARVAQVMLVFVAVGFVLASTLTSSFAYGIILSVILFIVTFFFMWIFIPRKSINITSSLIRDREEDSEDPLLTAGRSPNSNRSISSLSESMLVSSYDPPLLFVTKTSEAALQGRTESAAFENRQSGMSL